jgi:L-rhamnose mutarotase
MAMRDADKDRRKHRPIKNTNSNPPAKEPASYHELKQYLMNARADVLQWQQRAKENEEAASQLTQVQQENQAYQVEVSNLKEYAAQNYQKYLNEQKNYQQALCLYNGEKTRATELISLRDEWERRAKENEQATLQLNQFKQENQTYQLEINELKQRVAHNYLIYLNEQENYQQALARYNEAVAKSKELTSQCDAWQQRAEENEEAVSQLIQVQKEIQANQVEVNEFRELAEKNYQKYLDEQKNYHFTMKKKRNQPNYLLNMKKSDLSETTT